MPASEPVEVVVKGRRRIQPAKALIHERGYSLASCARLMGVQHSHLHCCIHGIAAPNDTVRAKLPALLGVKLETLFEASLLSRSWTGTRLGNSKAKR